MTQARIERIASELTVVLFILLVVLAWIAMADTFFDWDLLQGFLQQAAGFLIAALALQATATTLLSGLLNLRRIAAALERRSTGENGS